MEWRLTGTVEQDCEEGPAQSPEASPGISRAEQAQFECLDTCNIL